MESENKSKQRPQDKFLSEMYDDFFYLISSINSQNEVSNSTKNAINNFKNTTSNITSNSLDINNEREKNGLSSKKDTANNKTTINNKSQNVQSNENALNNIENIDFDKTTKLKEFNEKIDSLRLTDESKVVLKKMIEYTKKYYEKSVANYIPFNMRIYTNNEETLHSITNLITEAFNFFNYMKNSKTTEQSLYMIEETTNISDLYNTENSLLILSDVQGLLNKEKADRDKLLATLEENIIKYSKLNGITTIITDTTKQKIDELFSNNSTLKDKIFDFELYTKNETYEEVYDAIISRLSKDYIITGEFEIKLLDYVRETYNKSTLSSSEYISALIEKILFNNSKEIIDASAIPDFEKAKSNDEIFKELNELVGLDNIKTMLKDLVHLMEFRKKAGNTINLKDTNLHMVFLGNPGTGKTTVARMVAGILYNLKYINQNKLVEVSAKDLIGQYVGQTAPKTMEVIEKALGGVLFIDEAYSLAVKSGNSSSFNEECIATLIQAMENYRDNLVVIFAGYSKEMDSFLKSNSGIVSRIGYTMEFKDYTVDELLQILNSMFQKSGFKVQNSAMDRAKTIIEEYSKTEGFGNARFVRNLYEKAIIKHATNTSSETSLDILKTISAEDITDENISKL